MATPAFEEFKKQQKAQSASTPAGAATFTKPPEGGTDSFKAFKESLKPKAKASAAPAPAPVTTPALNPLTTPKSSASFLTPAPLTNTNAQASDEAYKPVIEKAALITNAIQGQAKRMRQSGDTATRVSGALADTAIETVKDIFRKGRAAERSQSKAGALATNVDFAGNLATLGAVDFVTGAAPEVLGAVAEAYAGMSPLGSLVDKNKVRDVTEKGTKFAIDTVLNKALYEGLGGFAARAYEKVTGTQLTPEESNAVKSITTLGTMVAGFKGMQKVGEAKTAYKNFKTDLEAEFVAPAYQTLGVEAKTGRATLPELDQAYKDTVAKVIEQKAPDMQIKLDLVDSAYQVAKDYNSMNVVSFTDKWSQIHKASREVAAELESRVTRAQDAVEISDKAEFVDKTLRDGNVKNPRTALKRIQNEPDLQLAFESELVNMNAELDPKLAKQAAGEGFEYQRVNEPMSDAPARFDIVDGRTQIVFNEPVIQKQVARMMSGDVLIVGEGKLRRVFRRADGESFEALKKRFETELLQHELSHLKTVAPEDIAELRVARQTGDAATAERIRRSLEERANAYMFEKSGALAEEARTAIEQADSFRSAREVYREQVQSLKFDDATKEAQYADYRAQSRRGSAKAGLGMDPQMKAEFEQRFRTEETARREYADAKARFQESSRRLKADERRVIEKELAQPVVRLREQDGKVKAERRTPVEQRLFKERISRRLETQVLKEKLNAKVAEVRAKFKDKAAVRQSVIDYLRENKVPKEIRAKFINKVNAVKDADGAARIIQEINAGWDKKTRLDLMKKTVDLLEKTKPERNASGLRTGKLTAEVQSKLDRVRAYARMDATEVGRKMTELIDTFYSKVEGDKTVALPDDLAVELDLMEMGMLRTKSARRLRNNLAAIEEMIKDGKTQRQRIKEAREIANMRLVDDAIGAVLKGKEFVGKAQPGIDRTKLQEFQSGLGADLTPGISLFDGLGKKAKQTIENVNAAILSGQVDTIKFGESIQTRLNEIYGSEAEWHRASRELSKPFDFGTFTNKRGEVQSLKMTKWRALEVYLAAKDAQKSKFLQSAEGNAYTDEMLAAIDLRLTARDKSLANLIVDGYKELGKKLAPAVGRDTGVNMNLVEGYTGQLRREKAPNLEESFVQAMLSDHFDRLSTRPEFTKSRGTEASPLKFSDNPLIDLFTYARKANHYINVAESARKLDGLIGSPKFRNAVIDARGKSFYDALSFVNENVKRGASPAKEMSNAGRFFYRLQNNIITSLLMSPRVVAGQTASIASFRAAVADSAAKNQFWKGVARTRKNLELMKQYAPSLEARFKDMPSDQVRRIAEDQSLLSRGIDYVAEKLSVPLAQADKLTTLTGSSGLWEVKVKEYLDQGKSLEDARKLAGRFIDSTITSSQSTRSLLGKSKLELSSDVLQAFTVLQNQPNKLAMANVLAAKKWRRGELTTRQFADFVLWNSIIQPALYTSIRAAVGAGIAAVSPGKKEDEDKEQPSLAANVFMGTVEQNTGFLLIGQLVRSMQANFFGKNYELRPSVLQVFLDGLVDIAKQAGTGDYDEAALIGVREVLRSLKLGAVVPLLESYRKSLAEQNNERRKEERKKNPKKKKAK